MKNKILIGLAIVATALLVWVFVTPDKKKDKVRVCFPPTLIASLPHWVAMEEKFYIEEGLDVTEIPFADSKTMISSLYNNDADFLPAVSLADFIINSTDFVNKFPPLIISHSRMKREPDFEALLVSKGSPISKLTDLTNKKIAVYPGITSLNTIKYFLKSNGVDISNISFKPLSPDLHKDLLIKGDIDCSHLYEPFRSQALITGNIRVLYNGIYPSFNEPSAIGLTVISSKFYNEQPEVSAKLLRVWNKSITYIREHNAEARQILMKQLKLSEEVANKATWVDATLTTEVSENEIIATINSLKKIGLIDSTFQFSNIYLLKK